VLKEVLWQGQEAHRPRGTALGLSSLPLSLYLPQLLPVCCSGPPGFFTHPYTLTLAFSPSP
jgi:hypothetical protein